jgi:hypothetical protein
VASGIAGGFTGRQPVTLSEEVYFNCWNCYFREVRHTAFGRFLGMAMTFPGAKLLPGRYRVFLGMSQRLSFTYALVLFLGVWGCRTSSSFAALFMP